MQSAAIETVNLVKTYNQGKIKALDGVSLRINEGEVFGLIGPNGAGKSTLVGLLLGLLHATSGQILIFGRSPYERGIRRITGYLPERPQFDAWMTVRQFLRYHHMLAGLPSGAARAAIDEALQRVGLSDEIARRSIRKLSRGLLQRVGLAQALLGNPMLCFLDEPDSGMDPLGTQLVRGIIIELKQRGCTVLVNSHHLDQVERTCDRVAFISKGNIRSVHSLKEGALAGPVGIMRFNFASPDDEREGLIRRLAEVLNLTVLECNHACARLGLAEEVSGSRLIREFVTAGIEFEEALQERRTLEELFAGLAEAHKEDEQSACVEAMAGGAP